MSTFTKTLIASALAVAVAGPAAADVKEGGAFTGSKTSVKIMPSGCPNANEKNIDTDIGFYQEGPSEGCWAMDLFVFDANFHAEGPYIERKFGKDLTGSLFSDSFDALVTEMELYIEEESKCDTLVAVVTDAYVKKGNIKISKNGDRAKVDMEVEGEYTNDSAKTKKVKAKIQGKMDYVSGSARPVSNDCQPVVIPPPVEG